MSFLQYKTHIEEGDLVIAYIVWSLIVFIVLHYLHYLHYISYLNFIQTRENMTPLIMTPTMTYNNKFGTFKHSDMIGKEYGSRVFARSILLCIAFLRERKNFVIDINFHYFNLLMELSLIFVKDCITQRARIHVPFASNTWTMDARGSSPNANFIYRRHFFYYDVSWSKAWINCLGIRWMIIRKKKKLNRTKNKKTEFPLIDIIDRNG